MALSNKLEAYNDIERYFRMAAMNPNGGTVVLSSKSAAIRWRQRAYYFRKLWAAEMHEPFLNGTPEQRLMAGKSPWDDFVLILEENKIHIRRQTDEVLDFIPADGIIPASDKVSDTEFLNTAFGPAAKLSYAPEGPLELEVDDGLTFEQRRENALKWAKDSGL